MVKPVRKTSNKNPPILSHEFVIQNHADIVSCVAMVFVVGLMVQATSPIASIFIALQHNVTQAGEIPLYTPGAKDWAGIFFYSMICIVLHAIIQEYVLDKISKKLHLSKSKLAVFSSSGQLAIFYLVSSAWGIDIALRERYLDISRLWADYPAPMPFLLKLFIIIQLAYSVHELPELYFQRTKREEYLSKAIHSLASLVFVYIPYVLNFNRLLVCLLILHHASEFICHGAQVIQTIDKDEKFTKVTRLGSVALQILARLGSIILAVITLWYGLALGEQKQLDIQTGYFNILPVRLALLGSVLLLQVYLTFTLINEEIRHSQENKSYNIIPAKGKAQKKEKVKKNKKAEESDLPEVDQNTNKTLRNKQKVK